VPDRHKPELFSVAPLVGRGLRDWYPTTRNLHTSHSFFLSTTAQQNPLTLPCSQWFQHNHNNNSERLEVFAHTEGELERLPGDDQFFIF
jgi:hypothetical protein